MLRKGDETRKDEFADSALLMPSSQAIADEITQNKNAVGYYGMGYLNETEKVLAIAKDATGPFTAPTIENVKTGTYYISRPLFIYTNGEPQGLAKSFLDYALSPEGQKIVTQIDFVPIK